jgi:hypothetical protein
LELLHHVHLEDARLEWDCNVMHIHILPQSGCVRYWIKGEKDILPIGLFKLRYDYLKPSQDNMLRIMSVYSHYLLSMAE